MIDAEFEEMLLSLLNDLGYELWGIEYHSYPSLLICIYIELKEGSVNIDQCSEVANQLKYTMMTLPNFDSTDFNLEVSSPGLNRRLFKKSQYYDYIGERVNLKLNDMFENRKKIKGILLDVLDDKVVVEDSLGRYEIPLSIINRANIDPDVFSKGVKKNKGEIQ